MQDLRGKTIDPAEASAIMAHTNEVSFDGFGRIVDFSSTNVSPELLTRLESAVIKPLTTTNSRIQRDAPRTEREILTRAMHLLGMSNSLANVMLRDEAKQLFLSGSLTRESVAAFVKKAAVVLGQADDVLMEDQFNKLSVEISKPVTTTQLADNVYGRAFESLLVDDLIRDPPPGVLKVAHELGKGIMDTITAYDPSAQQQLLRQIANNLKSEPRPWLNHSPSLQQFMSSPSMETLGACLAETSNGIEAMKMPFIATNMALAFNGAGRKVSSPEWLRNANRFYRKVVSPQKPTQESKLDGVVAQAPGNWLHYHPKPTTITNSMTGYSWTHNKVHSPGKLSGFEKNALSTGQTVVNGPSGTTNLMAFFGEHLASVNPNFSQEDHHLCTLMFVVFDGGHSTQEVLSTLDAIKKHKDPASWGRPSVAKFSGGYEAIAELSSSGEGKQALQERLGKATESTVDYFAQNVA